MGNARQFALDIETELEFSLEQWRIIIRKVALLALKGVVNKTPVKSGRARSNWFVEVGSAGLEVSSEVDKSGNVSIARGDQVIGQYQNRKDFPDIVIYNNLPYIRRLENGYSKKAPAGMVAVTVAELQVLDL